MSHTPSEQPTRGFSWCSLLMLAAGLAVVLVGDWPSLAADDAKPAKALPADLALVPEDAAAFLYLEVGKHWNGPEAMTLEKVAQSHPIVPTWWARDLAKHIGVNLTDLERVVAIIADFQKMEDFVAILTTRKPFDRAKVLGALVPEAKEMKVEAKTYYVSGKSPLGVRVVNERTLLLGSANGVKGFLSKTAATGKGPLQGAVAAAATGEHLLVARINPSYFLAAVKSAGDKGKTFVPLFAAKSWQITADAAKELRINLRLDFANEAAAKEGQKALKGIVEPLIDFTFFAEKGMDAFYKREADKYKGIPELSSRYPKLFQSTRTALKDFKSEQVGSTVRGTLHIKTDEPVTSFVLLLSMMPRAAKE
jgi:hypothetical protein